MTIRTASTRLKFLPENVLTWNAHRGNFFFKMELVVTKVARWRDAAFVMCFILIMIGQLHVLGNSFSQSDTDTVATMIWQWLYQTIPSCQKVDHVSSLYLLISLKFHKLVIPSYPRYCTKHWYRFWAEEMVNILNNMVLILRYDGNKLTSSPGKITFNLINNCNFNEWWIASLFIHDPWPQWCRTWLASLCLIGKWSIAIIQRYWV